MDGCAQQLIERTSILRISPTVRIAISDLGHTRSSHNIVATFYTNPRRSPTDFYHLPHSPVLPTTYNGLILIPTPITLNPKPNEHSQSYNPSGSRNRGPGLPLRKQKSSYFLSYKPDSLESERRRRLLISSSIGSRSTRRTIVRRPRRWT